MSEANHTPGPWIEIDYRIFAVGYVLTGAPVATVHARNRRGVRKANARLIAAAPEMLEALQSILKIDTNGTPMQDRLWFWNAGRPALDKARAAISKATGKEAQE